MDREGVALNASERDCYVHGSLYNKKARGTRAKLYGKSHGSRSSFDEQKERSTP